jgi:hypothetical protein
LPDIVDTAMASSMFNTLVTAIKAAGLVDTLRVQVHSQFLHPQMKHSLNCLKRNLTCS